MLKSRSEHDNIKYIQISVVLHYVGDCCYEVHLKTQIDFGIFVSNDVLSKFPI